MSEEPARVPESKKGRDSTTVNLAIQAQNLDFQSCTLLCERLTPALLAWARLRVSRGSWQAVDPDELVQEVWLRALSRLSTYDPAKGTFRMWIFGIAGRAFLDLLRRAVRHSSRSGQGISDDVIARVADDATAVSVRLCRDEALSRIGRRFAELSQDDLKLILYRGLEGLPHDEVARRLGIGTEAATKRWHRLRARFESEGLPDELLED